MRQKFSFYVFAIIITLSLLSNVWFLLVKISSTQHQQLFDMEVGSMENVDDKLDMVTDGSSDHESQTIVENKETEETKGSDEEQIELQLRFPVDLVYRWVNGSAPGFREKMLSAWKKFATTGGAVRDSVTNNRFQEYGAFRHSIRSVCMNIPWIRHIFVVTNGDYPTFLHEEHDLRDRVQIVTHEEIFPEADHIHLPTFSSRAITNFVHRIKGLSEVFLVMDDDEFIGQPVSPSRFFTKIGGKRLLLDFSVDVRQYQDPSAWAMALRKTSRWLDKEFGVDRKRPLPLHVPHVFKKSVIKRLLEIPSFYKMYSEVTTHTFRHKDDINLAWAHDMFILEHMPWSEKLSVRGRYGGGKERYPVWNGCVIDRGEIVRNNGESYIRITDDLNRNRRALTQLLLAPPEMFCLNDHAESASISLLQEQIDDFFSIFFSTVITWDEIPELKKFKSYETITYIGDTSSKIQMRESVDKMVWKIHVGNPYSKKQKNSLQKHLLFVISVSTGASDVHLRRLLRDVRREGINTNVVKPGGNMKSFVLSIHAIVFQDMPVADSRKKSQSHGRLNTAVMKEIAKWSYEHYVAAKHYGNEFLSKVYQSLKQVPSFDYYIFLPDDVRLCRNFAQKVVSTWESVGNNNDGGRIILNIMNHEDSYSSSQSRYTSGETKICKECSKVRLTRSLNDAFMASTRYLQELKYSVPVRRDTNQHLKSICAHVVAHKFRIYSVQKSFACVVNRSDVSSGPNRQEEYSFFDGVTTRSNLCGERSVQADERSSQYVLSTIPPVWKGGSGIIASISSSSDRISVLVNAIDSIASQVDRVHVHLNRMKTIPEVLLSIQRSYPGKLRFTKDVKGESKDVSKLHILSDPSNTLFLGCADDLIYPPDYVEKFIRAISVYGERAVYSFHGGIFYLPIKDYYTSAMKGLELSYCDSVRRDSVVHWIRSNMCAFVVDKSITSRDLDSSTEMGDMRLSILAQKKKIPEIVLGHAASYFPNIHSLKSSSPWSTGISETNASSPASIWELNFPSICNDGNSSSPICRSPHKQYPIYVTDVDRRNLDPRIHGGTTVIALGVPTTTANTDIEQVIDLPLLKIFMPSLVQTVTKDRLFSYVLYVGFDRGDRILDNVLMRSEIRKHIETMSNGIKFQLEFVLFPDFHPGYVVKMWNYLFEKAINDGCDYFYQLNDDISFQTGGWTERFVNSLRYNSFHSDFGIAAPKDQGMKRIATQAFCSRLHFLIFGYFFPDDFHNWFADDWTTNVYGKDNTFRWDDIIIGNMNPFGTRYREDKLAKNNLPSLLEYGRRRIHDYMYTKFHKEFLYSDPMDIPPSRLRHLPRSYKHSWDSWVGDYSL